MATALELLKEIAAKPTDNLPRVDTTKRKKIQFIEVEIFNPNYHQHITFLDCGRHRNYVQVGKIIKRFVVEVSEFDYAKEPTAEHRRGKSLEYWEGL